MSDENWNTLFGKLNMIEFHLDHVVRSTVTGLNELNKLDMRTLVLSQQIAGLKAEMQAMQRSTLLRARGDAQLRAAAGGRAHFPDVAAPRTLAWEDQLAELRRRAPKNFDLWLERFETGRIEYEKRLPTSLSTIDHGEAFLFRSFVAIHGSGRMLDVGVGPLARPSYLLDHPDRLLAGVDPLLPYEAHPFAFARAAGEFLPWPDGSFETVISGTSIDHVYLLDAAIDEAARVLTPGGKFLLWASLYPQTQPYDPYSAPIEAIDEFHLFHPGENWFPQAIERRFRLVERHDVSNAGYANAFLAYEKR
jgi:SAM-dependent methyltransferase